MTAAAKPAFYDVGAEYTGVILDRQQEVALSVEGRQAAGKVVRLARSLLRTRMDDHDVGPGARDFLALSAAASIQPMISETVIAAHHALVNALNAEGSAYEDSEPECLDLLLALEGLLKLMRISPSLNFYPHGEGRAR